MDRRDFLKGSAAVGAGIALAPYGMGAANAERNIVWGALALPSTGQRNQMEAVAALETKVGRKFFDTTHFRLPWDRAVVNKFTTWSVQTGHTPIISWFSRKPGGGFVSWSSIASGTHDAWITTQARSLKNAGWSGYFCFHKEPENEGNATDWKAAHDRVYQIFQNVGVAFTFIPVLTAYTFAGGNGGAAAWLPPRYGMLGIDGYNRYGCLGPWRSFEQIIGPAREFSRTRAKPLYVIEYGSTEGGSGQKAAWIDGARAKMKEWPEIAGCSYNHELTDCNYRVDTSTTSLSAFSAMAKDLMF
jgi:hypothetical protein